MLMCLIRSLCGRTLLLVSLQVLLVLWGRLPASDLPWLQRMLALWRLPHQCPRVGVLAVVATRALAAPHQRMGLPCDRMQRPLAWRRLPRLCLSVQLLVGVEERLLAVPCQSIGPLYSRMVVLLQAANPVLGQGHAVLDS